MPAASPGRPGALMVPDQVAHRILLLRGQRVMLDRDLAVLYGVPTKVLNQAVRRHRGRFPEDFMFQLSRDEATHLRSQFVTSSPEHRGRRHAPYAFTEQGVAMLSSVLRSPAKFRVVFEAIRQLMEPVPDPGSRGVIGFH